MTDLKIFDLTAKVIFKKANKSNHLKLSRVNSQLSAGQTFLLAETQSRKKSNSQVCWS